MQQDPIFQNVLNKFGFDLEIKDSFSSIEFSQTKTVPDPKETIPIPLQEQFPLEEPKIPENDGEIPVAVIESAALELLRKSRVPPKERNGEEKLIPSNLLPTENIEDFILFKRELQTYFSVKSKAEQLPFEIQICHHPTCLNCAVPSFNFCTYHLLKEKNPILTNLTKNKNQKR